MKTFFLFFLGFILIGCASVWVEQQSEKNLDNKEEKIQEVLQVEEKIEEIPEVQAEEKISIQYGDEILEFSPETPECEKFITFQKCIVDRSSFDADRESVFNGLTMYSDLPTEKKSAYCEQFEKNTKNFPQVTFIYKDLGCIY